MPKPDWQGADMNFSCSGNNTKLLCHLKNDWQALPLTLLFPLVMCCLPTPSSGTSAVSRGLLLH